MMRKSLKERFNEEGYIVIPKLFSGDELQRLLEVSNRIYDNFIRDMDSRAPGKDHVKMLHATNPKWADSPEDTKLLLELGADPRCLGPVEQIFEGPSVFRATTYWVNPRYVSEEGNWHRDTQFGRTDEQEKEYIQGLKEDNLLRGVQFQIALVDNSDLEYVPYSVSRYDSPEEYQIRLADNRSNSRCVDGMPNALRFHLQAGDAVAFNQVGLHRGRYHVDKQRRTLMLTYNPVNNPIFDKIGYQPYFLNDGYLDSLSPRAATYYKEYISVFKEHWASMQQSAAAQADE
jgi:hypothetical protein